MQQMQQMQAAAQMPMMSMMMPMMPMAGVTAPSMPTEEDEEEKEMNMLSEEELGIRIRAQDAVVKEAEKEAKRLVDKGTFPGLKYVGTIISVDPDEGFGFVHSPALNR